MKTQHSDEEIQLFGVAGPFLIKIRIQKGALLCCNAFSFSVRMKLTWKLQWEKMTNVKSRSYYSELFQGFSRVCVFSETKKTTTSSSLKVLYKLSSSLVTKDKNRLCLISSIPRVSQISCCSYCVVSSDSPSLLLQEKPKQSRKTSTIEMHIIATAALAELFSTGASSKRKQREIFIR